MDKFQDEKIPLSVAVVDMDWFVYIVVASAALTAQAPDRHSARARGGMDRLHVSLSCDIS